MWNKWLKFWYSGVWKIKLFKSHKLYLSILTRTGISILFETLYINNNEININDIINEGQGSLVCCSPWGRKESDMTQQLNNDNNNDVIHLNRASTFSLTLNTMTLVSSRKKESLVKTTEQMGQNWDKNLYFISVQLKILPSYSMLSSTFFLIS